MYQENCSRFLEMKEYLEIVVKKVKCPHGKLINV
jgi:hypothetical protein